MEGGVDGDSGELGSFVAAGEEGKGKREESRNEGKDSYSDSVRDDDDDDDNDDRRDEERGG